MELQRPVVARDRLEVVAEISQDVPLEGPGGRTAGFVLDRPVVAHDRRGMVAQAVQGVPLTDPGGGVRRVDRDGLVEAIDRIAERVLIPAEVEPLAVPFLHRDLLPMSEGGRTAVLSDNRIGGMKRQRPVVARDRLEVVAEIPEDVPLESPGRGAVWLIPDRPVVAFDRPGTIAQACQGISLEYPRGGAAGVTPDRPVVALGGRGIIAQALKGVSLVSTEGGVSRDERDGPVVARDRLVVSFLSG